MKTKFNKKETLKRKNERKDKRAYADAPEWNDPEVNLASFEEAQADIAGWTHVLIA